MQRQMKIKPWSWSFVIMFMVLFSCADNMEEHYAKPSFLAGNAWEDLDGRGDYTVFLSGVEKAGFKNLVNGRGLVNVMAPNDAAFSAYFLKNEFYSSIDEMPEDELKKLIGYHLLFDDYNKSDYAHFNPYGSGSEVPNEMGLFYKHRTNAKNPITTATVTNGLTVFDVSVVHKELYLPVFSQYMFDTKGIDAKSNYEYFYPNSTWTDDALGFNVSEATVLDYEITTDNGFIYLIDRVLEPLETIHQSLKNKGNYSDFLSMYDRFSKFWLDAEATKKYGNGVDLFVHQHGALPMIASEWPYNGEGFLLDYENLPALSRDAFNVFVPDNATFQTFFQDYWADNYESLEDVDLLSVLYLLYNHVYEGSIVFPDEILAGEIQTYLGTSILFNPETDVDFGQVCANGAYYGMNKVLVPDMFNSITGPVYRDPAYQMFLYMVAMTQSYLPLSSEAIDYTIFYPTDSAMIKAGYYDLEMRFNDPNPEVFGDESVQILDGLWTDMGTGQMQKYVDSHVATELLTEVGGTKVYKSINTYSYIYVKNNAVASNRMYNEDIGFTPITPITPKSGDWTNGSCYNTDTVILVEDKSFKYEITSADETPYLRDYEEFSKLLTQAGLLSLAAPFDFILSGSNYMLFIPSNETILNAPAGTFPTEADSLAEYLKYYFVSVADNDLSDYAFPGANIQGTFSTFQNKFVVDELPSQLKVIDNGTELTLSNVAGGQTAKVISDLPNVYGDCAVYIIDALIQPE